MKKSEWKYAGNCGVDSGIIMFADPCYDNGHPNQNGSAWMKFITELAGSDSLQLKYAKGHDGLGVAIGGFGGDGSYPVYFRKQNGLVVEAKIVFSGEAP